MTMYIGEPFSWNPAAFEGSTGIMSVTTKETTAHGRTATLRRRRRSTGRSSERDLSFNKNQEEFHHEHQSGLHRSL